jgi:BioD-like phosphotransacetylase family protein
MSGLHVTSPGPGDGKTAVACALLRVFGLRGYERDGGADHPDHRFVAQHFAPADAPAITEGETPRPGRASLAVVAYRGDATAEGLREVAWRNRPIGAILNAVPDAQRRFVEREVRPAIEELGVPVLGVLPEERALRAASVGELAAFLGGVVMTAPDALGNLVENYMVGAMSHVSGLPYFNRKTNKAVVTGGDRLDVIMAALGTPCRCIIATGGVDPDPVLIERAEAEEVPIVQVAEDAVTTLDRIGVFLRGVRFHHEGKVEPFVELFRRNVELAALERALGVPATVHA